MSVSVVVPIHNERENVRPLYDAVRAALDPLDREYELVLVDDGSSDGSDKELAALADRDERVKVVTFRRNFGQTAALEAGIHASRGDVIVTMDGDLQNDPADIPMMLARLDEGYDLVHGWRRNRQDAFLDRKLPSKIANWLIARTTRVNVHDLGCSLKAIRREIALELNLQGEMHRYITILAHARGARLLEVETRHHPRKFGKTKYGISRTFRVILDLITVKFMLDYFNSPMKLFGSIGLWCAVGGFLTGAAVVAMKAGQGIDMTGNPLLLATAFLFTSALQFFTMGLLGEVCARIYYASRNAPNYAIRSTRNLDDAPATRSAQPLRKTG